jgi:hypothetical protein
MAAAELAPCLNATKLHKRVIDAESKGPAPVAVGQAEARASPLPLQDCVREPPRAGGTGHAR